MARELKRVPLDFEWTIGMIWKGFINPFRSQECKCCDGSGLNEATKKLSDDWYSFDKHEWVYPLENDGNYRYNNLAWSNHITDIEVEALVKEGRLSDFMDKWYSYNEKTKKWTYLEEDKDKPRTELQWIECDKPAMPTAKSVNEWNQGKGFGHDSINRWICVKARAKHLKIYGKCKICKGEGSIWFSDEVKKLHNKWKPSEPPKGKGYQLWSTTNEGSPESPVFDTLENLCGWCADNATTFADFKATKEEWKNMLGNNFVHAKDGNKVFI